MSLTYEEAEKLALRAIHDADGRGMIGRGRNHLHQRVARAILAAAREEARQPPEDVREKVARAFHEAYERLAPQFGYKTREASAVPWEDVPAANKELMRATVGEVLSALPAVAVGDGWRGNGGRDV